MNLEFAPIKKGQVGIKSAARFFFSICLNVCPGSFWENGPIWLVFSTGLKPLPSRNGGLLFNNEALRYWKLSPPVEGYVGTRNDLPAERLNFKLEIPTKYEQVRSLNPFALIMMMVMLVMTMMNTPVILPWFFGEVSLKDRLFRRWYSPRKPTCPLKKGPFQKEISSSNQWFSGENC